MALCRESLVRLTAPTTTSAMFTGESKSTMAMDISVIPVLPLPLAVNFYSSAEDFLVENLDSSFFVSKATSYQILMYLYYKENSFAEFIYSQISTSKMKMTRYIKVVFHA